MYCTRGESGKETSWSQTLKNWRRWTHLKSTQEDSMQRKCWRRWNVSILYSQTQMEQSKNPGRDRRLRPYTWIRDRPERGEDQEVFRGESDGLFSPNPFQDDSTRDDAEAQNDFCLLREISFIVITWNPWSNCTCRKRRIISYSDEVHRRYQNNTYITGRIVRKTDWWLLERRWRKRIIWCMDRHHKIPHIERKATWRIYMVGVEDWTTKQTTSRPDNVWPGMWKHKSDAAKSKTKQKLGCRETKARSCQTITWYLIRWTWWCRIQAHHQKRS